MTRQRPARRRPIPPTPLSLPSTATRASPKGRRPRSEPPDQERVRDFGEGQEDFPESPEEEHIGRFSEGQEEEPETPEKLVERDFGEGQEERPPGSA